ncbi:MAG: hypothetical protein ACI9SK_001717 [Zhongshania sp.]|jgi:hypothetical protein
MKKLICALVLLFPFSGLNALELNNDSSVLNFVTVKNDIIAELMTFKSLTGTVNEETGDAELSVDLNSVASGIDIRNSRMREFLFDTGRFPAAIFTTSVKKAKLNDMVVGEQKSLELKGKLALHGQAASLKFNVIVTKRKDNSYHVVTTSPTFINASSFDFGRGIDKLRNLAGLINIDLVVPVTFSVVFQ